MQNVGRARKFRKRFRRTVAKSRAGQGVQTISFHDERRTLYRRLRDECESFNPLPQSVTILTGDEDGEEHFLSTKILSDCAIAIIKEAHNVGKYEDRVDEREPPFMAPSPDPDDYSLVCTNTILSSSYG
jgi:hypothetical protein